ncbi:hypothetical protein RhiirC2_144438 [Rhizophagus irregularis]|uniref:Uncharacterized protein n=1 Tax=Rhizophagus irregularis TaxID=588596 RepID=A0A2N1MNQ1_9GLOM|nr:hypothetical protein RhiirC2_144438 [Rhizophagus irregularis]
MNNFERKKSLSLDQKLNLEQDLKQILPFYLTQNHIPQSEMRIDSNINMNPIRGQNTEQMISMNDVVDYTYNVTQPQQQIDSNNVSSFNRNSSSFHRSIGNNVITQQVDFNDISPPMMKSVYNNYRNTNSSNENIENNLMTTQVTSMIDNQVSHQNKVEDTKDVQNNFPQRQIPERETIPYCDKNINSLQNDTLIHDVPMTDINFDHRDTYHFYTPVEGITAQAIPITDVNQNYDDNDVSYNDNHDVNINSSSKLISDKYRNF